MTADAADEDRLPLFPADLSEADPGEVLVLAFDQEDGANGAAPVGGRRVADRVRVMRVDRVESEPRVGVEERGAVVTAGTVAGGELVG